MAPVLILLYLRIFLKTVSGYHVIKLYNISNLFYGHLSFSAELNQFTMTYVSES